MGLQNGGEIMKYTLRELAVAIRSGHVQTVRGYLAQVGSETS
jgi:hypothetical protein